MGARENHSVTGRRLRLVLLLGITAVATLSACGKKGPLYLPEEANAPGPATSPAANPAAPPPPAGAEEGAHQK
ncbi:MAG: LPS translocon maturation chaperone LptM [Bacteroidota bacterium]